MSAVEIKVPEVGESITEGTLVEWLAEDGALVEVDDGLFELETDKITLTVTAEAAGRLSIGVEEGATVQIGQVVGTLQPADGEQAAAAAPAETPAAPAREEGPAPHPPAGVPQAAAKIDGAQLDELSPAVRRLVVEHGLDPAAIEGTGKGGRLTKQDVLAAAQAEVGGLVDDVPAPTLTGVPQAAPAAAAPAAAPAPPPSPEPQPARREAPAPPPADPGARQIRTRMSSLRQRIAERLLASQQQTATLTTFNEVDLGNMMALRKRHKEAFEARHGIKLGVMSFFVKAAVDALKTVPEVNASIDGDEIVRNQFYDISVAVSTDRGLLVPVIRDADRKSFAQIERDIADLARRAQQRKLELHELQGGVFTVSNGGVFGSLLSTPILNPPQSAILGMHGFKQRPVVIGDQIVIRPMMYLALSYDHRLIDGREAVTFLRRIVDCIEEPERLILEV